MGHKNKTASAKTPVISTSMVGVRYANGDVHCQIHNDRIDRAVCTVRSIRQPEKCRGCWVNKQGGD